MESVVIAILAGLVLAIIIYLVYLRMRIDISEEREERREAIQEGKIRLLDMLTIYGFVFLREEYVDESRTRQDPGYTPSGARKEELHVRLLAGYNGESEIEFILGFDILFTVLLTNEEQDRYLKEYLFYLEKSQIWGTGPWLSACLSSKRVGEINISLRNREDLPKGGRLLI